MSSSHLSRPSRLEELEARDTPAFAVLPPFISGIADPTVIASGDFNGDGFADVAVGNATGGPGSVPFVGIALGDGRGGFTAAAPVAAATMQAPQSIAVTDFNADGKQDLAVGTVDPANSDVGSVFVFPGNGDGTFAAPTFQQPAPTSAVGTGDFNGDGNLDLFLVDAGTLTYSVLLGDGAGGFAVGNPQPTPMNVNRVAVADFDSDGNQDVVGLYSGGQIVALYGKGDGTFDPPAVSPFNGFLNDVVAGDFDGDGRTDLVVVAVDQVSFLLNLGGRQFDTNGKQIVFVSGPSLLRAATADFDRNGLPDLIVAATDGTRTYQTSPGSVFTPEPTGTVAVNSTSADVVTADADGDGNADAIFVRKSAFGPAPVSDGRVFLNLAPDSTTTTLTSSPNPSDVGQPVTLTATVMPTVAPFPVAGQPTGTVTFLFDGVALGTVPLTNGTATFTVSTLTVGTHQITANYSGDTAYRPSGSAPVIQTVTVPTPPPPPPPGPQTYQYVVTGLPTVPGAGADRVASGAFNADGASDLVLGSGPGRPNDVSVIDGNTRQLIAEVQPFGENFSGGVMVAAGDVDGDGVADLAVAADEGGGPRVRVYLTRGSQLLPAVDFFALDPDFRGGLRVALGDVNRDGFADLVVTGGPGSGPRVAVYDGRSLLPGTTPTRLWNDFFALDPDLRTGLNVAVGDLNGDGFAEIVVGADTGGAPRIAVFDGRSVVSGTPTLVADFFAGSTTDRGGVRLAVRDTNGDGTAELITGGGPGTASVVRLYEGSDLYASVTPTPLFETEAFPGLTTGIYVA